MLIFGEWHLRTILAGYEAHYNRRRPHRSRQFRPPRPDHPPADLAMKRIQRRPVLGGLINEYERAHRSPGQDKRPSSGTPTGLHQGSEVGIGRPSRPPGRLPTTSGCIGHGAGCPFSRRLTSFHHRQGGWSYGAAVMETRWTWPN